ncbi:hypothetical protein OG302_35470 [Streptomyces sp. NBC_01283]|uniref:hypothetical protein n=1 Tax=Streptomyces sp. NBC_01283 TaxID=2903812 RepID=UPI00352C67DB|nr:hypothetical protein OG302_35470 [Streptomyces sp. NBC_01283]
MLELLREVGVELPGGAGLLKFGMTPGEVLELLPPDRVTHHRQCMGLTLGQYAELRHAHDAWLGGLLFEPEWSFDAELDGVVLGFGGGGPGVTDRLARVEIQARAEPDRPEATPVAWDDIDLFGYPAAEIVAVLPGATAEPGGPPPAELAVDELGLRLSRARPAAEHWERVTLFGPGSGSWGACCAGGLVCAEQGDGLVGIMY